ncbi:cysteinyL-tRNA synthetasE [Caudoviricetes sp.]|nr:cysteinyL-tRNA synthetasE [Caudoviricetes sp.]
MSLIARLDEIEKLVILTKSEAHKKQLAYFKVINGLVSLHQKYRILKNYEVSDELRSLLNSIGIKVIQGTAGYSYEDIPKSLIGRTYDDQWIIDNS